MVLVTGNWRIALAGLAASLVIFAVVFFTVIQPSEKTANQAIKNGMQQTQQVLSQAQKQISSESGQAGAAASQASGQAQQVLSKAQQLAACVAKAGTDTSQLQSCQTQFGQ